MDCINCGAEVTGKFCSACGQRTNVKRITFKEGWYDFWARIYGFDGLFPRTLRDLTIRPGYASLIFIEGNRMKYYGPVGYFFLMITVFLLLLSLLDINFIEFMKGMQKLMSLEQSESEGQRSIQGFVADNLKLFAFLMIPFQAITARYFFFRKSGYNFLENTVLPFYTMGHLYWLSMISAIYYKITGSLANGLIQIIVSICYIGFAYTSFITYQSKTKTFFKGVGIYLTAQLLFVVVFSLVLLIYILLMALLDPDSLQMFRPAKR